MTVCQSEFSVIFNQKMNKIHKIIVFDELKQFLRLIYAFDSDNFRHSNWRDNCRSVFYAVYAVSVLGLLCIVGVVLIVWHLLENHFEWRKCVVGVPIMISILQLALIFIAMVMKNQVLATIIHQLQTLIDQRKCICAAYIPNLIT